ncbi:MAG: hypothetical protein H7836_00905 [Magnetococcus sp. YQC-3]
MLDGFQGKLTSSKWAAIARCSSDTALRDINELISLGVLHKMAGKGRRTAYELADGRGGQCVSLPTPPGVRQHLLDNPPIP